MSKTSITVNRTTVNILRRTFGNLPRETALQAINQILDTNDNPELLEAVDAACHTVLSQLEPGKKMKCPDLLKAITPLVGDAAESADALAEAFKDVLSRPTYEVKRGPGQGACLRAAQASEPSA